MRPRCPALAIPLALVFALAGAPAEAAEPPPGSKNFTPPSTVPNYFSNENTPFQSGAEAPAAQPGQIGRASCRERVYVLV